MGYLAGLKKTGNLAVVEASLQGFDPDWKRLWLLAIDQLGPTDQHREAFYHQISYLHKQNVADMTANTVMELSGLINFISTEEAKLVPSGTPQESEEVITEIAGPAEEGDPTASNPPDELMLFFKGGKKKIQAKKAKTKKAETAVVAVDATSSVSTSEVAPAPVVKRRGRPPGLPKKAKLLSGPTEVKAEEAGQPIAEVQEPVAAVPEVVKVEPLPAPQEAVQETVVVTVSEPEPVPVAAAEPEPVVQAIESEPVSTVDDYPELAGSTTEVIPVQQYLKDRPPLIFQVPLHSTALHVQKEEDPLVTEGETTEVEVNVESPSFHPDLSTSKLLKGLYRMVQASDANPIVGLSMLKAFLSVYEDEKNGS